MFIVDNAYVTHFEEKACAFESYPPWVRFRFMDGSYSMDAYDNLQHRLSSLLEKRIAQTSNEPIAELPLGCVATLIQRNDLLERLQSCGLLHVNQTDTKGYTAAHFAAIIGSELALQSLKQMGADCDQKTNQGASVHDFLRYRAKKSQTSDESTYSAEALLCLWYEKNPPATSVICKDFNPVNTPVPISVQQILCEQSPLIGQREAVANRDIQAGEFIVEYTGNVEAVPYKSDSNYIMLLSEQTVIDAEKCGSIARFINHGPSNCSCQTYVYKGVPRLGLFALRNLAKGEPLLFNYGANYFAKSPFFELNAPFLDAWIAKHGLTTERVEAAFKDQSTEKSDFLSAEEQREVYYYLYEFPDHLIDCVKQQKLVSLEVLEFFEAIKNNAAFWGRSIIKYQHEEKLKQLL